MPSVADSVQGYHTDVGIMMQNAGSLTWATEGSPWTNIINVTNNKLAQYICACYREDMDTKDCLTAVDHLIKHYNDEDPQSMHLLNSQQNARGGRFAPIFEWVRSLVRLVWSSQ